MSRQALALGAEQAGSIIGLKASAAEGLRVRVRCRQTGEQETGEDVVMNPYWEQGIILAWKRMV